jgi:hypothetical protein
MKKNVLLTGLLFLFSPVVAYYVYIDAPDTLTVGKPLVVTGETSFGIGTPIDVVLYYQLTTTSEIKRTIVYIQPDRTFRAVFDTTGLKTGVYKVEVPTSGMGGDSVTSRVIELVDRSDAIQIASPLTSQFTGTLTIEGTIAGGESSGIQVEVAGPDNKIIFGPVYVNTNPQGDFSFEIPIADTGNYEVSFTDSRGYIGSRTFTVLDTVSPGSPVYSPGTGSTRQTLSAHARATHDRPAFFIVETGVGPVSISTSSSVDWVIEYADDNGIRGTVNAEREENAERLDINGTGTTLYVSVYPASPFISDDVILYGQNVRSIAISPAEPSVFLESGATSPKETPQSPAPALCGIISVLLASLCYRRSVKAAG